MVENLGVIVIISAISMTFLLQVWLSKMKSPVLGLVMPLSLLIVTIIILIYDVKEIVELIGNNEDILVADNINKVADIFMYFSLYNVPTILFLCIYNYYKRQRKKLIV